jgi:hypothetical protein
MKNKIVSLFLILFITGCDMKSITASTTIIHSEESGGKYHRCIVTDGNGNKYDVAVFRVRYYEGGIVIMSLFEDKGDIILNGNVTVIPK